jgi:hypothetical protein
MEFRWDDQKNISNQEKHGIDFLTATAVFDDPYRLEIDSTKPEHGEMRTKTIGMIDNIPIIAVVSTDREQHRRIISARMASQSERKEYETRKKANE